MSAKELLESANSTWKNQQMSTQSVASKLLDLIAKFEAENESELDKARKILRDALNQVGCDGDLCMYQWHEDARKFIDGEAE